MDCQDPGRIVFPDSAFNLEPLNSRYDDWNCGAPWERWESASSFIFSTNWKSEGGTFDLNPAAIQFKGDGDFSMEALPPASAVKVLTDRINTIRDELGPTFWFQKDETHARALLFSRGDKGNHDLIALSPNDTLNTYSNLLYSRDSLVEIPLTPLNTPKDEGYATWSADLGLLFFHSNRDGRYGIYQARIPLDSNGLRPWLRNPDASGVVISRVPGLSSDGEERCPFILGNDLYFISDRPGGLGGFDIYRSTWNGAQWADPVNLGPRINSAHDEYRPLPFRLYPDEVALFFSSNRPGGLGGYDLYASSLNPKL